MVLSETDRQVEDAFARHKRGDIAYAADVYRKALETRPEHARALHYLGLAAQQMGNSQQAVQLLERAIKADPADARAYNHLGQIQIKLGDKRAAAALFERAVAIDPDHVESLNSLANVTITRDLTAAIALYRRVLALSPRSAFAAYNLAQALNEDHAFDEAVEFFERTIALDPNHSQARFNLGILLEQRGQFSEAIAQYLAVWRRDRRHVSSLANMLGIRDYTPEPDMAAHAEDILRSPGVRDEDRIKLHRGLGKHYERSGDFDRAFGHFSSAKTVFRRTRPPFNLGAATKAMDAAKAVFSRDFFAAATPPVSTSDRPIFIVGLPRSGTTLTEQILASHAQVFGAGELPDIPRMVKSLRPDYPHAVQTMDVQALGELADEYLDEIARLAGADAMRVTDKMPVNSLHLGLIAKLFPAARVIYCRRDPRDIAVSCFVELFELEHDYTTDFADFAAYFLEHERLMAHWRAVLPIPIHELRYEELIADPQAAIRGLVDHCGLDWDPACLNFQATERTVQTPSRWQVRQPLYQTSIGRWRRYEAHIGGLMKILDASGYVYGQTGSAEAGARPSPDPSRQARGGAGRSELLPTPLRSPLFIVAAPRSGSTLLFETLARSQGLCTVGGEAHWLVESLGELRPGEQGVESNRLTADDATDAYGEHMIGQIMDRLIDCDGETVTGDSPLVFLEKTPKNALRIPFFERIFPQARFIFLWRDPHENISSIMEAWRSGRFTTYRQLPGFRGPWSLLLPPNYHGLNQRPLEEVAAFQWEATNRIVLDDLAALDPRRWISVNYADLVADPAATVARLLDFAGIERDAALDGRLERPLPHSQYTQTPPSADKWRANAAEIERVQSAFVETWRRLQALN
jgi:tetratricopeptide (TPR) repeat protein